MVEERPDCVVDKCHYKRSGYQEVHHNEKTLNVFPARQVVNTLCDDSNDRIMKDRINLLNVFPEEVWMLIFKKVEDNKTLENLNNSSLVIREMLAPQRVYFLFESVWQVMATEYYQKNLLASDTTHSISEDSNNDEDEITPVWHNPSNYGSFHKWIILLGSLRLVCHPWCKAIDDFYQNHPLHFKLQGEPWKDSYKGLVPFIRDDLSYYTVLTSFFAHFDATHRHTTRNPFFGRSVFLYFSNCLFIQDIFRMFLRYGHHVWYCVIHVRDNFPSTTICYCKIRTLMRLMPNLKAFCFIYSSPHGWRHTGKAERRLQRRIKMKPFPTFKSLQMLSINCAPVPLFEELVEKHHRVTTLDLQRSVLGCKLDLEYNIYSVPMPNLRTLSMQFQSTANYQSLACPQAKWPLTKLCLSFVEFVKWQDIFNVIERRFKNSLKILVLNLPSPTLETDLDAIYYESETYLLNLPHLTELRLSMKNLACLDFILPLRESLVVFNLDVRICIKDGKTLSMLMDVEAGNGKVIKLLSCAEKPLESNIWKIFPKLEQLQIYLDIWAPKVLNSVCVLSRTIACTHSRADWEIYQNNRIISSTCALAKSSSKRCGIL